MILMKENTGVEGTDGVRITSRCSDYAKLCIVYASLSKMKNNEYHTVGTVLKHDKKIIETEVKSRHLTNIYMTSHFWDDTLAVDSKIRKKGYICRQRKGWEVNIQE